VLGDIEGNLTSSGLLRFSCALATSVVTLVNLKVGQGSFQKEKPSTGGFFFLEVTGVEPASERACGEPLQVYPGTLFLA